MYCGLDILEHGLLQPDDVTEDKEGAIGLVKEIVKGFATGRIIESGAVFAPLLISLQKKFSRLTFTNNLKFYPDHT